MGFFKKDATTESARSAVTIIAQGNRFSGEMNIVGKLHIDGLFEGRIASLDAISVGKRGELHGHIQAHEIHVSGTIEGEVHCDEMVIENGGEVRGILYCDQLVIERKGCFIGERRLKNDPKITHAIANDPAQTALPKSEKRGDIADMLGQMLQDQPQAQK